MVSLSQWCGVCKNRIDSTSTMYIVGEFNHRVNAKTRESDAMSATRPTLSQVARRAGVSISTASLAFSESGPIAVTTREKVLTAAKELGYTGPSALGRQLRSGKTGIVGVVIGDAIRRGFRDPVLVSSLDGLVRTLGENGLGVLLIPGDSEEHNEHGTHPLVQTAAMDAGILLWGGNTNDPAYRAMRQRNIPVVIAEGQRIDGAPHLGLDDRTGMRKMAEHLRSLGHQHIACVTLSLNTGDAPGLVSSQSIAADRIAGDAQADPATDHLPSRARLRGVLDAGVTPTAIWQARSSLIEDGQQAARALLDPATYPDGVLPTAIMAQSDLLAAGVLQQAREMGFDVPRQLSVTGFDGVDLPWLGGDRLTTVRQPLPGKGEMIGSIVVSLLEHGAIRQEVLDVEFVAGNTAGPAPQ